MPLCIALAVPHHHRRAARLALLAGLLPEFLGHAAAERRKVQRGVQTLGPVPPRGCSLLSLETSVVSAVVPDLEEDEPLPHPSHKRRSLRGPAGPRAPAALAGVGAERHSAAAAERAGSAEHRAAARGERGPFTAGWFGDFSQGESTFRTDGVNARPDFPEAIAEEEGYAPAAGKDHLDMPTAKPDTWFQETASAGSKRVRCPTAWQTFYPPVGNFRSRDQHLAPWRGSAKGAFQETYEPDEQLEKYYTASLAKNPAWFDNSVSQYDAFGRGKLPSKESKERYVEFTQRSHNTSLTCKNPGCEVNASLKVFNHAAEEHEQCKLSVVVHPTDFDDEFSREYVELVQLNGREFNFRCHPQALQRTCGASGEEDMVPCLKDFPLDGIVKNDGLLNITGRISPMVDECPVKGNLLSGVVVVTCMVHPSWMNKPKVNTAHWLKKPTPPPRRGTLLRCKEPGCIARATVLLAQEDTLNKTCRLTVTVAQTDFDGNLGSTEEVEWVKVAGNITKAHIKPGRNPCKERLKALMQTSQGAAAGDNATDGSSSSSGRGSTSSGKSSSGKSSSGKSSSGSGSSGNGKSSSSSGSSSSSSSSSSKGGKTAKGTKSGKAAGKAAGLQAGNATGGRHSNSSLHSSSSSHGAAGAGAGAGNASGEGNISSNFTPSAMSSIFGGGLAGAGAAADAAPVANWTDGEGSDVPRYTLINGSDVTAEAMDGQVEIAVKISGMVDECGSDGFLLDAEAVIECS